MKIYVKIGDVIGDRACVDECEYDPTKKNYRQRVIMKCKCGREDEVTISNLLKKQPNKTCNSCSLGHGPYIYGQKEAFGNTICKIFERCYKKSFHKYEQYGGRGIKVWPPWINNRLSFRLYLVKLWYETTGTFSLDMYGQGADQLTLDRIDNDGHYEPGNLRFTDKITQANNTRRSL